ncbi:MAG: hypothetical protein KF773_35510 [Deltaproteobacteria bacterium]|nr:hypothetical protein [Deltaproteobacteria bacterium]MCW5805411.1 hypothetical protein [Deltaproteobacteria bacterium]
MLLLDERILPDGRRACTWARRVDDRVEICDEGLPESAARATLSVAALDRVMRRYGRALDPAVPLTGDALDLGNGTRLRRLRHHAPVDATGRDYLVWEVDREEPLAAIARSVTAALRYLVLRLHDEDPQKTEG